MSAPTSPLEQNPPIPESVDAIVGVLTGPAPSRMWGPFLSFFLSLCTFGLLPLFVWQRRWNAFAADERRRILAVASFWRRRASVSDAQLLDAQVSALEPQTFFTVVPILVLIFSGLLLFSQMNDGRSLQDVVQLTVGYAKHPYWMRTQGEISLHIIWVTALLIGYICHYLAVRTHTKTVQDLVLTTGRIAGAGGGRSTVMCAGGVNPLWIVAAIFLCGAQAWWGIPLVLGGAMQRQYVRKASPRIRDVLARQFRDGASPQATRTSGKYFCGTPRCAAPLRAGANFCSRCGAKV